MKIFSQIIFSLRTCLLAVCFAGLLMAGCSLFGSSCDERGQDGCDDSFSADVRVIPGRGVDGVEFGDSIDDVYEKLGPPSSGLGWVDGLYRGWRALSYDSGTYAGLSINFLVEDQSLAKTVCGDNVSLIKGEAVYRLMANVKRLVPSNVGLLDVRNLRRRFTMHVGADVTEGFPVAEAQTKTKTNIFAFGFESGVRISVGASLKGRIWSYRVAMNLKHWVDWCNHVGPKLLDGTVDIDEVMGSFIRPQIVEERPELYLLGLEWHWDFFLRSSEALVLEYQGTTWPLIDTELEVASLSNTGPVRFNLVTPNWRARYTIDFQRGQMNYVPLDAEVIVNTSRQTVPLSEYLTDNGLTLLFEDEAAVVPPGILLEPPRFFRRPG